MIDILKTITKMPEDRLHKALVKVLKDFKYETIYDTRNYIMAVGDLPVGLVAHLDTVHVEDITYLKDSNIMYKEINSGFDDRAGVAAILAILETLQTPLPTVIFTHGEETGGIGAQALKNEHQNPQLKYLIELDRQGEDDAVFYACENPEFTSFILSSGFSLARGSFSDISFLCPAWRIAGVNLSIGYFFEHTVDEYLNVTFWQNTIAKVVDLLKRENVPTFVYKTHTCICKTCGKRFPFDMGVLVEEDFYCFDDFDIRDDVDFCLQCGEPYYITDDNPYCPACRKERE